MRRIIAAVLISALSSGLGSSVPRADAKPTEPGQTTIWDQIMEAQSARDLQVGYMHMERRDYEGAIREFAKAVLANPQDPIAHLMLGSGYYWAGNVPQAEAEFREALKLDPKNAQGHLLMGIVHAWKGETEAAYASFSEGARLDPNRADLQMDLGSIEETLGRYPDALVHFRKAVTLEPDHPLYHYQIGMLYRRLGRDSDAADSLRASIKRYPDFEDALIELGAALERLGQPDDSLDLFKRAVKIKSRDAVARYRLGRAYLLRGDVKRARSVYADAFHLTPEDSQGGLALSVAFGGKSEGPGRDSDSRSNGENGKSQPPAGAPSNAAPGSPLEVLGRNLERLPLDQDAELQIEMAFLPKPKLVTARPSEVPSSLKKALADAAKPPRPTATGVRREFALRASNAAERRAQVQKIMQDLREVMKQAPPDAEVRMGMNLSYAPKSSGSAYRGGEAGAGRADSKSRVSYQPRPVGNDMGLWVMGTGWMALVEETLPDPGESPSHPDTSDWWVSDGLGQAALGNAKSAAEAFDRALSLDRSNELAWLGRAVAMVEAGRDADAIEALQKVVQLQPKNRPAKEGLKWLQKGAPQP